MLSGKCFQAYLPSHIQLCWNNQMLSHSYLGRGWLTAANYCSICCPQQLLAWITPTGTEGHSLWCGALEAPSFLGSSSGGSNWDQNCTHEDPITEAPAWLSRWPEQPCPAGQGNVTLHREDQVLTDSFLLHPVQHRLNLAQWYCILVPAFFPVCCCSSQELAEGLLYHIWSVDTCSSAGL